MSDESHEALTPLMLQMIAKSGLTVEEAQKRLKEHSAIQPEPATPDLSGRVVIVTGSNVGIGYETAKFLAKLKPKLLILACRNTKKANEAADKIKAETGCTTVEAWDLDLASLKSVKAFAKRFLDTGLPLDILVSNAAVASFTGWVVTEDGYELTTQVNHLANALLVLLLVPAISKAPSPRVELVSSGVHFSPAVPTPDDPTPVQTSLKKPEGDANPIYPISKLFNVLFVKEFARRCPHKNIWICSSNPGFVDTELGSKDPATGEGYTGDKRPQVMPKRTPYEGAKTIIYCVVDPSPGANAGYYSESKEVNSRPTTVGETGEQFGKNVWRDTMDILGKHVEDHSLIVDWAWN